MSTNPPHWAIEAAIKIARWSWCAKDQRGVVAWAENGTGEVTSQAVGANGPPPPFKCSGSAECRAACGKVSGHAEERALWAWGKRPGRPILLHVKLEGDVAVPGGGPSCVGCSRTMLMAGAAGIWLWLDAESSGTGAPAWRYYDPVEFHTLSLLHPKNALPVIR